jgi:sulfatase modifying factor 1
MRSVALVALVTSVAYAGERPGKIVRVEHAARREVYVPAGKFWMGVTEDDINVVVNQCGEFFEPGDLFSIGTRQISICNEYHDELDNMKQREVFVSAFAIDRYEVTVADYRECITAGVCTLDPMVAADERYIRDEWPLVNVTWFEAADFCRWRGGRLPSEAEWERAARGAEVTNAKDQSDQDRAADNVWPWCEDVQNHRRDRSDCVERPKDFNHGQPRTPAMAAIDRSNIVLHFIGDPDDVDGFTLIAPPGSFPWSEGPYGTRDQAGNVAEWVADARTNTNGYEDAPGCTKRDEVVTCINPRRDGNDHDVRVVRGGSWRQPSFIARSNVRDPFGPIYEPHRRFSHVGFRCARSLTQGDPAMATTTLQGRER